MHDDKPRRSGGKGGCDSETLVAGEIADVFAHVRLFGFTCEIVRTGRIVRVTLGNGAS